MKNKVLISAVLILLSTMAFSQPSSRVGISGTLQESQYGFLIPIWVGEKIVIAPAFDLKIVEKVSTDIGIALAPRYYFKKEKVAPYLGLRFGTLINKPSTENKIDNEQKVDLLGGVAFGGEYFLSENFSFGVELQGNITKSDENSTRFGNPDGIIFNTGTMICASIYF